MKELRLIALGIAVYLGWAAGIVYVGNALAQGQIIITTLTGTELIEVQKGPEHTSISATNLALFINGGSGGLTGLDGQVLLGVTGLAPAFGTMSQDCTITNAGVITCTKTNNVAFGTLATANAVSPPALGGTTPAAGKFTTLQYTTASGFTVATATDSGHTTRTLCEDTTSHVVYFGSGTVGVCAGTSSLRFKHDIAPLEAGLSQVLALEPISYKLNADHGDPDHILYGFSAEQGGTVLPKLMQTDAKGEPNTFDYVGVVPVLVRAIQEQQAQIDDLKRQLTAHAR